jgi:methionine synthase II (cobalamin-independent)
LLRPKDLAEARAKAKRGELPPGALKEAEDRAIRAAVARQEAIGLESITDGEFRRDWWHLDFLVQLDGVIAIQNPGPKFGGTEEQPPIPSVTAKVGCSRPIMADHFSFLKSATNRTAKFTIPSPAMLHLRGGRGAISREAYPDIAAFWTDIAAAYRKAIRHLADAGCIYLQLDDVSFSYLCDERIRETCRKNGDDPALLPRTYAEAINAALADRPAGMTITMHTCRGNFKSAWVASGGYEPVPRRCSRRGWTASSWSSIPIAPAPSSRCASCPRARRWCWAWSPPRPQSSRTRTRSSAASRRPRSSCRSSTFACRRSAAFPARTTATSSRSTSSGASSSASCRWRAKSGAESGAGSGARTPVSAPLAITHTHVHSMRATSGAEVLVARVLATDGTPGFGFTFNLDGGGARHGAVGRPGAQV